MEILEKHIKGKKADSSLCEDMIFISEGFVAVVDGATAKHPRLFNGKAGGRAAAEAICEALSTLSTEATAYEAVNHITAHIENLYEPTEEKCSAVASAIIYSTHRKEVWSVGDCQCIINGEKHLHEKEIDHILSEQRAQIIEEAIKNGATYDEIAENDIGRQAILPRIMEQHRYANDKASPLGYGVLNGNPVPEEFIVIYTLKDNDILVLASDGYPSLCDTLEESEALLEKEIFENPLCCTGYKSTKGISPGSHSFDDRAYIKLKV